MHPEFSFFSVLSSHVPIPVPISKSLNYCFIMHLDIGKGSLIPSHSISLRMAVEMMEMRSGPKAELWGKEPIFNAWEKGRGVSKVIAKEQ